MEQAEPGAATAQEGFKHLMRDLIGPRLLERGFTGSYTRGFRLRRGDYTGELITQKNRYSTKMEVEFWVHLLAFHEPTQRGYWERELHHLIPGMTQVGHWTIEAGHPADPVAAAVLDGFWQYGWPALQAAMDPRVFEPADEAHRPSAQPDAAPGSTRAAIAQYAQGDPRALPVLFDRLAHDPCPDVREDIALLLTNRATEPAIQQALQSALRSDTDRQVRWAANYAMRLADSA